MDKYAKFEVPEELLGQFVAEVNNRELPSTVFGVTRDMEHIVTIPYDKENEEQVDELNDYLSDLIAEVEEFDDEEEEDEDENR